MQPLCRHLRIPCLILRMLLLALAAGGIAYYMGFGGWATVGVGFASLFIMQVVYFLFIVVWIWRTAKRDCR